MDQPARDTTDDTGFDKDWEEAEKRLIPIDNSHLSDEVHNAAIRADEQLAKDEARLEENINSMNENGDDHPIIQEDGPNLDVQTVDPPTGSDVKPPKDIDPGSDQGGQKDNVTIGTELGFVHYFEAGRVEAPERTIYNDIIPESESESSGNPERLG